jgi:hypothetical protein
LRENSLSAEAAKDIASWIDQLNLSRFRTTILTKLRNEALIHFDKGRDLVTLFPPGIRYVESSGILVMS